MRPVGARVRWRPADHYRILGAELRIDKPAQPGKLPDRMVAVVIVDYGGKRHLHVLVNASGAVAKVEDLTGSQPPFSTDEIAEARAIAEQDSRVARHLGREGLFVSDFGPAPAPDYARRVGLRYVVLNQGRIIGSLALAIVDLSARKLVEFEETPEN